MSENDKPGKGMVGELANHRRNARRNQRPFSRLDDFFTFSGPVKAT